MELQEYKKRLSELTTDYEEAKKKIMLDFGKAKKKLMLDFAKSRKHYNVGDIIKSSSTIIKIEEIKYIIDYHGIPTCKYLGTALKRDLTPRKVSPFYDHITEFGDNITKLG